MNPVYLVFGIISLGFGVYLLLFKKEWLVWLCYLLVPLSIPIGLPGGSQLSLPSEILMAVLGFTFLVLIGLRPVLSRKILLHPISIMLFLEICWMIIASISSSMPGVSFKRVAIRTGFIIFFYLFMAHWFSRPRRMVWPMLLYAVGAVPVVIYTLKKHAVHDFIPQVTFNISQPFFHDHTIYGASLAFILPFLILLFFYARKVGLNAVNRSLVGLLFLVILTGLLLSFSRAALLSLLAAGLLFGLIQMRIRLKGLLVLFAVAIGVVSFQYENIYNRVIANESVSNKGNVSEHFKSVANIQSDASNLERINRWICAIRMFKEKPVSGFGPGSYQFEYGKYQSEEQLTYISTFTGDRGNAHSEYLTYLSETGLPGLLIFLMMIGFAIVSALRVYDGTGDASVRFLAMAALLGLTTFFVHGLFNAFIEQDKMAALVYPALAVIVALEVFHKGE